MFCDYTAKRNYQLLTLGQYRDMLNNVAFNQVQNKDSLLSLTAVIQITKVVAADKTSLVMDMLKMELVKFEKIKDTFGNQFTLKDFEDVQQVVNYYTSVYS